MKMSKAAQNQSSGIEVLETLLAGFPKVSLSRAPTPIQFLPRLSEMLGIKLYCKRDDLTGFGYGGNKIRKLEFLVKAAMDEGADTLVTCGSNQSNWACMTAAAGAVSGLPVHLVLGGGKPEKLTGNLILDSIMGAEIHFLDSGEDEDLENAADQLVKQLETQGQTPYQIIMGGSNGLGTLGYVDAFREILQYETQQQMSFAAMLLATGSGGTQAGLVAGKELSGWQGEVIGMNVSRSSAAQQDKVRNVLAQFDQLTGTQTAYAAIVSNDSYVGDGYRKTTAECREAIELFARNEGIFLDEVYSGKAAAGLIDYARKGRFSAQEPVLFVHTGGSAQLFE